MINYSSSLIFSYHWFLMMIKFIFDLFISPVLNKNGSVGGDGVPVDLSECISNISINVIYYITYI